MQVRLNQQEERRRRGLPATGKEEIIIPFKQTFTEEQVRHLPLPCSSSHSSNPHTPFLPSYFRLRRLISTFSLCVFSPRR